MKTSTKVILTLWAAKTVVVGAVVAMIRSKRRQDEAADATHKQKKDIET